MDELEQFGKGAVREDIPDPRDFKWGEQFGMSSPAFDWSKGYDVEAEVSALIGKPFKLKVKDQNGSSSCGGQAWGYYGEVLDAIQDKIQQEKSAKYIYAQTFTGTGGSSGRENCNICINQGWGNEADCPSYDGGNPPTEAFMQRKADITQTARDNAKKDLGLAYGNVMNRDAEDIAKAVRDNHGCIFGITGTNNGTWRSAYPKPPITFSNSWNHWVYVGRVKVINGKKYFGIINSWGESVGEKGWQWISEEYVKTYILGYAALWSIWTMVAKADVILPPPFQFTKNLKFGMVDAEVKVLQEVLKKHSYFPFYVNTTNYFGTITRNSVKNFQAVSQLTPDGLVGPLTREKLNKLV